MFRVALRGCLPVSSRLPLSCRLSSSKGHDKELEFFLQFGEGSVDMTKDEKTGVATVVLNQPKTKNALSGRMMSDLSDIVADLESWSAGRGVLLYGSNHNFCAGADLNILKLLDNPVKCGIAFKYCQEVLNRFYRLPLVSLALIEGRPLGGGAELACSCDFRAMTTGAAIGFVQVKMSVSPGFGGGARLVEILGRSKALRLLASGRLLTGEEAMSFGLADVVVPDGDSAVEKALEFLKTVTAEDPTAVQSAKRVVINASKHHLEAAMDEELNIIQSLWGSPKHRQAMQSGKKFVKTNSE